MTLVQDSSSACPFHNPSNSQDEEAMPDSMVLSWSSSCDDEEDEQQPVSSESSLEEEEVCTPSKSVRFSGLEDAVMEHQENNEKRPTRCCSSALNDDEEDSTTNSKYQTLYFDALRNLSSEKQLLKRKDKNLIKLAQELHTTNQTVQHQKVILDRYKALLKKKLKKEKAHHHHHHHDESSLVVDPEIASLRQELQSRVTQQVELSKECTVLQEKVQELSAQLKTSTTATTEDDDASAAAATTTLSSAASTYTTPSTRLQAARASRSAALLKLKSRMVMPRTAKSNATNDTEQLQAQIQTLQAQLSRQQQQEAALRQTLVSSQEEALKTKDLEEAVTNLQTKVQQLTLQHEQDQKTHQETMQAKLASAQRMHQIELANLERKHQAELKLLKLQLQQQESGSQEQQPVQTLQLSESDRSLNHPSHPAVVDPSSPPSSPTTRARGVERKTSWRPHRPHPKRWWNKNHSDEVAAASAVASSA